MTGNTNELNDSPLSRVYGLALGEQAYKEISVESLKQLYEEGKAEVVRLQVEEMMLDHVFMLQEELAPALNLVRMVNNSNPDSRGFVIQALLFFEEMRQKLRLIEASLLREIEKVKPQEQE